MSDRGRFSDIFLSGQHPAARYRNLYTLRSMYSIWDVLGISFAEAPRIRKRFLVGTNKCKQARSHMVASRPVRDNYDRLRRLTTCLSPSSSSCCLLATQHGKTDKAGQGRPFVFPVVNVAVVRCL